MDRQLTRLDAVPQAGFTDQVLGQGIRFLVGNHPTHHVTAENVDDLVEVVVGPFRRSVQLGDVPRPEFIRARGEQLRFGVLARWCLPALG